LLKIGLREKGKEESKTMSHYYMEEVYQAALKKSDGKVMKRFSMILDVEGLAYSQFASVEGMCTGLNSVINLTA
jgi:hypothetical protein